MSMKTKIEFCKDVFSSRIFMDKNDNNKLKISEIIQPNIARIINSANSSIFAPLSTFDNSHVESKPFLHCYTAEGIKFYVLSDNFTEGERYFAAFQYVHSQTFEILGLVESTSNFHSNVQGGLDKDTDMVSDMN